MQDSVANSPPTLPYFEVFRENDRWHWVLRGRKSGDIVARSRDEGYALAAHAIRSLPRVSKNSWRSVTEGKVYVRTETAD